MPGRPLNLPGAPTRATERVLYRGAAWVLDHTRLTLAVLVLLTAAALAVLPLGTPSADMVGMFVSDGHGKRTLDMAKAAFGDGDVVLIGVPRAAPTSRDTLDKLAAAEEALARHPGVDSALSVHSAPRVVDEIGMVRIETWGAALRRDGQAAAAALAADRDTRLLVAKDAVFLVVRLKDAFRSAPSAAQMALPADLRGLVAQTGLARADRVRIAGFPVAVAALLGTIQSHLTLIIPLTGVGLLALMLLLYRRLWPMAFALVVAGLASVWASAVAVAISGELSVLQATAPILISVISLADTVFFIDAFTEARAQGMSPRAAALHTVVEVGRACVLTTLSTALSSCSFLLLPAKAMQVLGVTLTVGVASALFLVLVGGVLFLGIKARPLPPTTTGLLHAIRGVVDRIAHVGFTWPRTVVALCALLTGLSLFATTKLEVETDFGRRYPPGHALPEAEAFIKSRIGTTQALDLLIAPPKGQKPLAATTLKAVQRAGDALRAEPGVTSVLSAATVVSRAFGLLAGTPGALPTDDAGVAQTLLMLDQGGTPATAPFVSEKTGLLRVRLQIAPTGLLASADLSGALKTRAETVLGPGYKVHEAGVMPLLGRWIRVLLFAQIRGLLLVALLTVLLFAIGLGSWRVGVVALWPNALPVTVFLGSLALPGHHFDSDYLVIAIVGLGIAVDDTIHILARLRDVLPAHDHDHHAAMRDALSGVGPAMAKTTIVLTLGLLPVLASDFLSARMYFTQLSRVLIAAFLADVLLVPALVTLGWLRFPRPPAASPSNTDETHMPRAA